VDCEVDARSKLPSLSSCTVVWGEEEDNSRRNESARLFSVLAVKISGSWFGGLREDGIDGYASIILDGDAGVECR
jgi:hypothetical protein